MTFLGESFTVNAPLSVMELVDIEVAGKQKELLMGTVKVVFQAKVGQMASRAA